MPVIIPQAALAINPCGELMSVVLIAASAGTAIAPCPPRLLLGPGEGVGVGVHGEVGAGEVGDVVVILHLPIEGNVHGGGSAGGVEDRGEGGERGGGVGVRVVRAVLRALAVWALYIAKWKWFDVGPCVSVGVGAREVMVRAREIIRVLPVGSGWGSMPGEGVSAFDRGPARPRGAPDVGPRVPMGVVGRVGVKGNVFCDRPHRRLRPMCSMWPVDRAPTRVHGADGA